MKFAKYDVEKEYIYPTGEIASPQQIKKKYSGVEKYTFVIQTDSSETMLYSMEPLVKLRSYYDIDFEISDDEAIKKINELYDKKKKEEEKMAKEYKTNLQKELELKEREIAALEQQNKLKEIELARKNSLDLSDDSDLNSAGENSNSIKNSEENNS